MFDKMMDVLKNMVLTSRTRFSSGSSSPARKNKKKKIDTINDISMLKLFVYVIITTYDDIISYRFLGS